MTILKRHLASAFLVFKVGILKEATNLLLVVPHIQKSIPMTLIPISFGSGSHFDAHDSTHELYHPKARVTFDASTIPSVS